MRSALVAPCKSLREKLDLSCRRFGPYLMSSHLVSQGMRPSVLRGMTSLLGGLPSRSAVGWDWNDTARLSAEPSELTA